MSNAARAHTLSHRADFGATVTAVALKNMDTAFQFDLKQRNTLNVSGLAAYVQKPPLDRVGWIHAQRVWLPDWQPEKRAYQVQQIEVTLESYYELEKYKAQQMNLEPWEVLMATNYALFFTEELDVVENFFARWTDRPEFAQHPQRVNCPHEYASEKLSLETPARWSLIRRAWINCLLYCQQADMEVIRSEPEWRTQGKVSRVGWSSFDITTATEVQSFKLSGRYGFQFYRVEEDGYIKTLWYEPTARASLNPENLPLWSYADDRWVLPDCE